MQVSIYIINAYTNHLIKLCISCNTKKKKSVFENAILSSSFTFKDIPKEVQSAGVPVNNLHKDILYVRRKGDYLTLMNLKVT